MGGVVGDIDLWTTLGDLCGMGGGVHDGDSHIGTHVTVNLSKGRKIPIHKKPYTAFTEVYSVNSFSICEESNYFIQGNNCPHFIPAPFAPIVSGI